MACVFNRSGNTSKDSNACIPALVGLIDSAWKWIVLVWNDGKQQMPTEFELFLGTCLPFFDSI